MDENDFKRLVDASAAETQRRFEETAERISAEIHQHLDETAAEMRRHFDVTTEGTRHEIRLNAEKVVLLDEELHREAADIRSEIRTGFADTQAMIKFSHAELDRRVRSLEGSHRALEEGFSDLLARVERLEGSTH